MNGQSPASARPSWLRGFVHKHRKLVRVLIVAAIVLVAFDVGALLTFQQAVQVEGSRIQTDRQSYGIGQSARVSLYVVNNLDYSFDACVSSYSLLFKSPVGLSEGLGASIDYNTPHCNVVLPGSERLVDSSILYGPFIIPGVYTLEVTLGTSNSSLPKFTGSATLLVVPVA